MATITYSPAFGEPPKHQPYYGANPLQAAKRFFTKYATFTCLLYTSDAADEL